MDKMDKRSDEAMYDRVLKLVEADFHMMNAVTDMEQSQLMYRERLALVRRRSDRWKAMNDNHDACTPVVTRSKTSVLEDITSSSNEGERTVGVGPAVTLAGSFRDLSLQHSQ